jgi:hypothetical protein
MQLKCLTAYLQSAFAYTFISTYLNPLISMLGIKLGEIQSLAAARSLK